MSKLTTSGRKRISSKNFAFPKERKYPIHDRTHAANALSRGKKHLSSAKFATLKRKVCARYKFPTCKRAPKKG